MAIFNNGDKSTSEGSSKSTTIITQGAFINGEIRVKCSLFVDGEVEGTLVSEGDVTVGVNGVIKGDVTAKNVLISGCVSGTIDSDRIAIQPGGSVEGVITSSELIIEAKGSFLGESKIKETQKKQSPKKSETV